MGVYLTKPKTDKKSECGGDFSEIAFGLTSMQGWRKNMEDAHLIHANLDNKNIALFGVFDGHGGPAVARWVGKNMLREFQRNLAACEVASAKWNMNENVPCDLETTINRGRGKSACGTAGGGSDSENSSDHEFAHFDCEDDPDEEQDVKISAGEVPKRVALVCEALQKTYMSMDERLRTDAVRQNLKVLHEQAFNEEIADSAPPVEDDTTEWQRMLEMYLTNSGQKLLYFGDDENEDEASDEDEGNEAQGESAFTKYASVGPVVEDITDEITADGDQPDKESPIKLGTAAESATAASVPPTASKDNASATTGSTTEASLKSDKDQHSVVKTSTDNSKTTANVVTAEPESDKTTAEVDSITTPAAAAVTDSVAVDDNTKDVTMTDSSTTASAEITESDEEFEDNEEDTLKPSEEKSETPDPRQMLPYRPEQCGSTVTSLAIVRSEEVDILVTANAGDSRIVLCRGTQAIPLTRDHKPQSRNELRRIENAGGKISMGRVDGNLNLSRCVGDLAYKMDTHIPQEAQRITAFPDIRVCELSREDKFVIIACDGIWDCMTNQELVDYIIARIREQGADSENGKGLSASLLSTICEEVCDRCLANNPLTSEGIGCDNMTLMIVTLGECLRTGSGNSAACSKPRLYSGRHYRLLKKDAAATATANKNIAGNPSATLPISSECIAR
eukprot:Lankesteria_metandrocarpae@DN3245_c0_g1_i1.p1